MSANNDATIQLVAKYNKPGPRYTSYPTAPEWTNAYKAADFLTAVETAAGAPDEPLSIYLHIPFCHSLCWFCGCNRIISKNPERMSSYLDYVRNEVNQVCDRLGSRNKVSQFHWGGGSPSALNGANTDKAFEIISNKFEILPDAEVAIELDPRTTSHEKIDQLKTLGFNRLSFGVQDMNKEVQEAIGRNQTERETVELYDYCRAGGFKGVNLDLVYGLPKQTPDRFAYTVQSVVKMRPDRIAVYSFAHLPKTLPNQKLINNDDLPAAQEKLDMFTAAAEMFLEAGYVQIGMDHFVLPDDELAKALKTQKLRRNFMGYTVKTAADSLGFGLTSISYISSNFAQNFKKEKDYFLALDNKTLPVNRGLKLSTDDLVRQYVISELMCNFRLDLNKTQKLFDIVADDYFKTELAQLNEFQQDKLLEIDGDIIKVTEIGRNFIRNIAMVFDAYLKNKKDVQFSRTI